MAKTFFAVLLGFRLQNPELEVLVVAGMKEVVVAAVVPGTETFSVAVVVVEVVTGVLVAAAMISGTALDMAVGDVMEDLEEEGVEVTAAIVATEVVVVVAVLVVMMRIVGDHHLGVGMQFATFPTLKALPVPENVLSSCFAPEHSLQRERAVLEVQKMMRGPAKAIHLDLRDQQTLPQN